MFRKYSIISLKFLCAPVVWNAGHISFTKTTVSGYRFPKQALQSVLLKSYGKYKLWKALVIVLGLMCNSFHGEGIVGVLEWNGETSHWIAQACESPGRQPVSPAGVGTSIFLASDGSCSAAGQSRSLIILFFYLWIVCQPPQPPIASDQASLLIQGWMMSLLISLGFWKQPWTLRVFQRHTAVSHWPLVTHRPLWTQKTEGTLMYTWRKSRHRPVWASPGLWLAGGEVVRRAVVSGGAAPDGSSSVGQGTVGRNGWWGVGHIWYSERYQIILIQKIGCERKSSC